MARHPEASFRAAAVLVMGQTSEDRYAGVLRHMLQDTDPLVRRNALRATRRINLAGADRP
jgi:HEAT repeat protein